MLSKFIKPATWKVLFGFVVPIPTRPLFCWTTKREVPTVKPPVEKVEDAVVEVAWKVAKVGVEVGAMAVPFHHSGLAWEVGSEEDETLLLKRVQSAERRQPKTEPEAVSQSTSLSVRVRPAPKVSGTS